MIIVYYHIWLEVSELISCGMCWITWIAWQQLYIMPYQPELIRMNQ